MAWRNVEVHRAISFTCGFCDRDVASNMGYVAQENASGTARTIANIRICPRCNHPTYFYKDMQIPEVAPGNAVAGTPDDVRRIYEEARKCIAAGAHTAAVLTCRKLLMNVAVAQGAPEGQNFLRYVDYLAGAGYVPPNGRHWVDHIRTKGNEANHEIALMRKEDAVELVEFSEMLLKFIYEFPSRVPKPTA